MFDDFEKTDFPVKSCTKKNPDARVRPRHRPPPAWTRSVGA